ncbi:unnamed protein product [Closterium sp. Yama58-4]|nr:unnamed protein product [Closterium sp. Yama58-4]
MAGGVNVDSDGGDELQGRHAIRLSSTSLSGGANNSERQRRYRAWVRWSRVGHVVTLLQTGAALFLTVAIVQSMLDSQLPSCPLKLGYQGPSTYLLPLALLVLVASWIAVGGQCLAGSDVLMWRSFYAMRDRAWRAHYREMFNWSIREILCCMGRARPWDEVDDEVDIVASLLGDVMAYRAVGASHLELLAGGVLGIAALLLGDVMAYRVVGASHLELLAGLALLQANRPPPAVDTPTSSSPSSSQPTHLNALPSTTTATPLSSTTAPSVFDSLNSNATTTSNTAPSSNADSRRGVSRVSSEGSSSQRLAEGGPFPSPPASVPITLIEEAAALLPLAIAAYTQHRFGPCLQQRRYGTAAELLLLLPLNYHSTSTLSNRTPSLLPTPLSTPFPHSQVPRAARYPALQGDNWWRGHASAFLKYLHLPPSALRKARVRQEAAGQAVYFVVVLHQLRLVVVAVRGTESLEDMIIDGLGRECPLSDADMGGIDRSELHPPLVTDRLVPYFGHAGVVTAARDLALQLDNMGDGGDEEGEGTRGKAGCVEDGGGDEEEGSLLGHKEERKRPRRGILSELLGEGGECEGYGLRLVGHSMGGAVCSLTAIRLRKRFPELRAIGYGSMPCVDFATASACSNFITTFVYNDEFSPRTSVASVMRLRAAALRAVAADTRAGGLLGTAVAAVGPGAQAGSAGMRVAAVDRLLSRLFTLPFGRGRGDEGGRGNRRSGAAGGDAGARRSASGGAGNRIGGGVTHNRSRPAWLVEQEQEFPGEVYVLGKVVHIVREEVRPATSSVHVAREDKVAPSAVRTAREDKAATSAAGPPEADTASVRIDVGNGNEGAICIDVIEGDIIEGDGNGGARQNGNGWARGKDEGREGVQMGEKGKGGERCETGMQGGVQGGMQGGVQGGAQGGVQGGSQEERVLEAAAAKPGLLESFRSLAGSPFASSRHRARFIPRESLRDLLVSPSMFLDHLPWRMSHAFKDLQDHKAQA